MCARIGQFLVLIMSVAPQTLAGNSTPGLFSTVIIADHGQAEQVSISMCSWIQKLPDPDQIFFVVDYTMDRNVCGFSAKHVLVLAHVSDYVYVLRRLRAWIGTRSQNSRLPWASSRSSTKQKFLPWVLVVQGNTFVQPSLIGQHILDPHDRQFEYTGLVRDAVSELAFSGHLPHVAHEYGILMSLKILDLVTSDNCQRSKDFHAIESTVTLIARCRFYNRPWAVPSNPHFLPWQGPNTTLSKAATLGPLSADDMRAVANNLAGESTSRLHLPQSTPTTPLRPEKIVYAVLTRESDAMEVVDSILSTWADNSSVVFLVSTEVWARTVQAADAKLNLSPSQEKTGWHSWFSSRHGVENTSPSASNKPSNYGSVGSAGSPFVQVSPNYALGRGPTERQVRIVGLDLPHIPEGNSKFYGKGFHKNASWNQWLRDKVKRAVGLLSDRSTVAASAFDLSRFDWFVIMDDDTYVQSPKLLKVLEKYDYREAIAVGRKFTNEDNKQLLGGGPGIALSGQAILQMRKRGCLSTNLPIISFSVPGGDGWLGQCCEMAGVKLHNNQAFKSLPPVAYAAHAVPQGVSWHKASVRQVHEFFAVPFRNQTGRRGRRCDPVLTRGRATAQCLPSFTIIGAQKAGTTSLFEWLGQHPQVKLPKEKELNFFSIFAFYNKGLAAKQVSYERFVFQYLSKFRVQDARKKNLAFGEASPDYLVSGMYAIENMLRYVPRIHLIVSLRNPIERAISAYKNKVADKTVHKMLNKHLHDKGLDPRFDNDIEGWNVPTFNELTRQASRTLQKCPSHATHYTLAEAPNPADVECYVNPFVLHGYYAKYLAPWFSAFPNKQIFVSDFSALQDDPSAVMETIARFLSLRNFKFDTRDVFNTRENRGVHGSADQDECKARVGGCISAVEKSKVGLASWAKKVLKSSSYDALIEYYTEPNKQLSALLAKHGFPAMSWAPAHDPPGRVS